MHWHAFETAAMQFVFLPVDSQVFQVDRGTFELFRGLPLEAGLEDVARVTGVPVHTCESETADEVPRVRALSLAISQSCNLACTYCYAQQGNFGGAPKMMLRDVAFRAVDFLLAPTKPGDQINLSFLGGEPLLGRTLLRETVEFANAAARERGVRIGFAMTTNGTLVTEDDVEFFARHRFAVTVSLDGIGETHDRLRPHKNGEGTFAAIIRKIEPLLKRREEIQTSARVTVTPSNLSLSETLTGLLGYGFHSVGISPLLSSPDGRGEMDSASLDAMLERMVECGELFERHTAEGIRFPFSNMATAMAELHRGTRRNYPCGAGLGYLGVSAEGALSACHRFVGDSAGAMGDLARGVDDERRNAWLEVRQVDRQEPCRSCWARYLCGGGCHHEVIHRGRPACNFIRGWLDYCLKAYVRLLDARPDYFTHLR
jgi:uncharacterized protein